MLSMHIQQKSGQLLDLCRGPELSIDTADALSSRQFSGNHQLISGKIRSCLSERFSPLFLFHRKDKLDICSILVVSDDTLRNFSAQCDLDGTDQDRFAGTGLTGQDI